MVIWVWVTRARSLPSALVSRVCKRLERRLMCTGVASPVTTEPTGAPRRKLVLLSSVVVRVPVARFSTPPDRAQRIGERHIGPAVQDAAGGAEILPDGEPANHPGLLALLRPDGGRDPPEREGPGGWPAHRPGGPLHHRR